MTSFDVLIIGGGIIGLWVAKRSIDAGLKVAVVDKGPCGSGGSGGVLGALMPHLPNAMNEKNHFQFQALAELPDLIQALEEETGLPTGYKQCGRLMPVRHEGFLKTVELCKEKSTENWQHSNGPYHFDLIPAERYADWLDISRAPLGLAWDTLGAKLEPRKILSALKTAVLRENSVIEDFEVVHINPAAGKVRSKDGRTLLADKIVLAAGYQSYSLLQQLTGVEFGGGVKGQAALFSLPLPEQKPVLYDDGMYIVHHAPDHIAVGSTTEPHWSEEKTTDTRKTAKFLDKAMALCPLLKKAKLKGLWAGIRPKSLAKDPMIGPVTQNGRVIMASGGFKISFGIAHRLADYITCGLINNPNKINLPETYSIEHHIQCGVEMGRISEKQREQFNQVI